MYRQPENRTRGGVADAGGPEYEGALGSVVGSSYSGYSARGGGLGYPERPIEGGGDETMLIGCRYVLPPPVTLALERVFGEPVRGVIVIERSRYARAHLGMWPTTPPNRVFLALDGQECGGNTDILTHGELHD